MQDRPTVIELLDDIADLLEGQLVPALDGPLQHQARVAGNLCRIIRRELAIGPTLEQREVERLIDVMECEPAPVLSLNALLAKRVRDGDDEEFEARAWRQLVQVARDKLEVTKPGYGDYDFSVEAP